MAPDRGLSNKQRPGTKSNKARMTFALTMNASGTEKLPPFIIGKYAKPRAFRGKTGKELGFQYYNNAKAWMTGTLFDGWISMWDIRLRTESRNIILWVDNFSGHSRNLPLTNIRLEFFKPNLTPHVQPADAGIIKAFKAAYRARFVARAVERYDLGTPIHDVYQIDQLTAMRFVDEAWKQVSQTTIQNCWKHAGISVWENEPVTQSLEGNKIPEVEQIEEQLQAGLNELQARGILQASNMMSLTELLDSSDEAGFTTNTAEDILNAVKNAEATEEEETEDEPVMTTKEAMQCMNKLRGYMNHRPEEFARSLDRLLTKASKHLSGELQAKLVQRRLTDLFKKKE